jgi:hypothetical protein
MDERTEDSDQQLRVGQTADVFAFASILFDILIDRDVAFQSPPFDEEENQRMNNGELPTIPGSIPMFVRDLIENGWSRDRSERRRFVQILEVIEENGFEFTEGVDVCEVFEWVKLVED